MKTMRGLGVLISISVTATAGLKSPFPSTVPEIPIPNTHLLDGSEGQIIRGMEPQTDKDAKSLRHYGVSKILIFRNNVGGESTVESELDLLKKNGFKAADIQQ